MESVNLGFALCGSKHEYTATDTSFFLSSEISEVPVYVNDCMNEVIPEPVCVSVCLSLKLKL